MITKVLGRWLISIAIAVVAISALGLVLNQSSVQARVNAVHDWPGAFSPCDNPVSLQQCIDLVPAGDVIHILPGTYTQSVTLNKPISLIGDNQVSTTLFAEPFQRVLTVTGNLTASTVISGLTFKGGNLPGTVCPAACGGAVFITDTARPALQNLMLTENTAYQGGGMWVFDGPPIKLTNVSFVSNTTQHAGGGLYAIPSTLLVNSYFERNTSNDQGGGVHVDGAASTLTVNGTEFQSNSANYGGGVYVNGVVALNFGRFTSNRASQGGGLYANDLIATGTTFISNTSSFGGGGLYASGPLTLTGASFISNTTQGSGGGAYGQTVVVSGSTFERNYGQAYGGGLYANNTLIMNNTRLTNNSSGNIGGGAYSFAYLESVRNRFVNNSASTDGGGLGSGGLTWITSTTFFSNSAFTGGGVYRATSGDTHIANSLFAHNQASEFQSADVALAAAGNAALYFTTMADAPGAANAVSVNGQSTSLDMRDSIIVGHDTGINLITGTATADYNLFFNNTVDTAGGVITGTHNVLNKPPMFVDPLHDNYHLRSSSPARNAGVDVGVYEDFDGQLRPIGPGFDIGFDETAATLQELIDSTPPGGTVNIPAGVYTESLTLYKPVNLVGAGPGNTIINAAPNDRVLTVTSNTILPTTQIASLTLRGGRLAGTCSGFCAGGGVLITGTAYPAFRNVVINDNQAVMGAGLYVYMGGAQLFDSSVTGNQAMQSGGGAYVEAANAVLEQLGGTFGGNQAIDGAGVFVQSGQFKQTGGVIYGNTASNWGGGMLIGSGGTIQTLAGQIISNSAQNAGGGVFVDVGTAELRDSLIVSNTAHDGGGVYVRDMAGTGVAVIDGKLEGNFADANGGYGGGVYAGGTLLITGTRFFKNTAYDGSALEITSTAQARLVNAIIAGNEANGAFPSTNSSVRFDSSGGSVVLHTTFGNATEVLTRALTVNSGVVTVANTIVASYTHGLSQFGGYLTEDYNLFFRTPITFTGSISNGGHSLIGPDPLFKNPFTGDYHIKGLSPAVNQGANVGVRRDIDLDPRPLGGGFDIGADEASVASVSVVPGVGGDFTYTTTQYSTINLDVPPGAVTQTTPIYCSLIDSNTLPTGPHLRLAGVLFELDAQLDPLNDSTPGSINFNVPVTLTVSYTPDELAAAGISDETSLKLYRFEPSVNDWKPIGYRPGETQTLDVNNKTITAVVLGFSRFGKLGAESGSDIFLPLIMR